jgi:hypothetical protein
MLAKRGYNVTTLSASAAAAVRPDLQPTRANMAAWIRALGETRGLRKAAIFYAGHGSQLRAALGLEADGMDECLVCQSSRGPSMMPGAGDLYRDDDLLRDIRAAFGRLDIELFLMFDACHSGTICDLGFELSRPNIPAADGAASAVPPRGAWSRILHGYTRTEGERYRLVCISAAQDNEVALEAGSGGGMLTNKFMMASRRGGLGLHTINAEVATMGFQRPQISAAQPTSQESVFWESILPEAAVVPGARGVRVNARSPMRRVRQIPEGRRVVEGVAEGSARRRDELWAMYRKLAAGRG